MTDPELKALTLKKAAELIRRKELSSLELTQAVLSRCDRLNDRMRAFITITGDEALAAARAADQAMTTNGNPGALHGVPLSLKDLYDTRGIRTTAGSRIFAQRIPSEDAQVVKRLKDAGAVIVGKNNLHEFAYGVTTINPHYGTARNPWNPDYVSGGSSGGSASAVALSLGFGSMGSDTGGSIRIPASLCGVVGLKPTYGRCSLRGVVPLSWSLDHSGPMAQTVEDIALLLQVIAGHDPLDPFSCNREVPSYLAALTGNIRGVRVGVPRSYFFDGIAPEVDAAIQQAQKSLSGLGATIVDIDLPSAPMQRGVWSQIASPESYSYHETHLAESPELYGADVRGRLEIGRVLLSIDYVKAQKARTLMRDEASQAMQSVDVILTPTLPIVPPRIETTTVQRGAATEPVGVALTRNTRHFNVTGQPCISLTCGFTDSGLPIGMQLAGRAFDESTVLRVAHAYEQTAGWYRRRPEL